MAINLINKKILYRVVIWSLLIISVYCLVRIAPILFKPENLHSDDFVRYWAVGRLNLLGENPYELHRIQQLQSEVGDVSSGLTKSIVLNPPWAIAILMPFALLDYPVSRLAWLIGSILLILISMQMMSQVYNWPPNKRWITLLVAFLYAPTISMLEVGQITAVILFGVVGFVYFTVVNRNDWMAGICIAIVAIKPQVVLLFWLALLFWVIQQHRWLIPLSALFTVIFLSLIAYILNPHIIQQYSAMMQTYQISEWANPTIGSYIRYFWFGTDKFWIQFVPTIFGGVWFLYYWYAHHTTWNWKTELPVILLVSQLTSPYSWTYDLVILVPAILLAVIWMSTDWKHWMTLLLSGIYLILNILDLVLHMKLDDFWFIWMVPALFLWFLFIRWQYPNIQGNKLPG